MLTLSYMSPMEFSIPFDLGNMVWTSLSFPFYIHVT
jgi:hypothetical protein